MHKSNLITILVIIGVIILAIFILSAKGPDEDHDEEVIKCIGEKAILYVQTGCPHCRTQEEMFGDNLQYINLINCYEQRDLCLEAGITAVPSWEINGQLDSGVKSIEKLKELTNC